MSESSLGSVLLCPASGVDEAVTGYPVGRGNGVSTVFPLPSEIIAVTTLYRTDWQGTVALSPNARTNVCLQSENLGVTWTSHTGTMTVTATTLGDTDVTVASSLKQQITVPNDSLKRWLSVLIAKNASNLVMLRFSLSGGSPYSIAIVFDTVTGRWGIHGNYGNIPMNNNDVIIKDLGVYGWRVSLGLLNNGTGNTTASVFLYPAFATTLAESGNTEVVPSLTGSAGFTKMQVEQAPLPTPYIPTATSAVTVTDYSLSGSTVTFAEVPALAAELTADGTGNGIPMLRNRA